MLQGLVVCGKCGRRMLVSYSGPSGRVPRYVCAQGLRLYGSARSCQSLSGRRLDAAVVQEMFTVLQPAALAATAAALAEAEDQHARRVRAFELAVERARYEAERARRQFDAVEPENRLVARSLESDWEARLFTLRQAEADLAAQRSRPPAVLTEEEVAWLSGAGADLRAVFDADSTTIRERKQLLRLLISEVVITVDRDAAQAAVRIRWEGGAGTDITVALPRRGVDSAIRTEADTLERIRRLAAHYDDATIARLLARQGVMTATGLAFTRDRVGSLRRKHGIAGPTAACRTRRRRCSTWSVSPKPRRCWAPPAPPSTGGWPAASSTASSTALATRGGSASTPSYAPISPQTHPTDGSGSSRLPADSAWPNRPSWIESAAASSTPSTSTVANAKAWPSNCR